MDRSKFPLFSADALKVLNSMTFKPGANGRFDLMSGGLVWPDEFPPGFTQAGKVVYKNYVYRFLLAYRASSTLGEKYAEPNPYFEHTELRPIWEQVVQHAPNWPGLRPERRGEEALRNLRVALRLQSKCLAEIERDMD
jgi:hypothetical protein